MHLRLSVGTRTYVIPLREARPPGPGVETVRLTRRLARQLVKSAMRRRPGDTSRALRQFLRRAGDPMDLHRVRDRDLPDRASRHLAGRTAYRLPAFGGGGSYAGNGAADGPGASSTETADRGGSTSDEAAEETPAATLDLVFVYPDGLPVAKAPFTVEADGDTREGTLGSDGTAHLNGLPASASVTVRYDESPEPYAVETGGPNPFHAPDRRGTDVLRALDEDPAFRAKTRSMTVAPDGRRIWTLGPELRGDDGPERLLASTEPMALPSDDGVLGWIWGVLQGDFNEEPSASQIAVGTVLSMIPGVDQVMDARDVVAQIICLSDPAERERPSAWMDLTLTAIGLVPTVGSAIKGAGRLVLESSSPATRSAIRAVLNSRGKGGGLAMLDDALGSLPSRAVNTYNDVHRRVDEALAEVGSYRWILTDDAERKVASAREALREIHRQAGTRIREAAEELRRRLREALGRGSGEQVARGRTGGRLETTTETQDLAPMQMSAARGDGGSGGGSGGGVGGSGGTAMPDGGDPRRGRSEAPDRPKRRPPPDTDGPGAWEEVNEHMSERAARYQEQITGYPATHSYRVNGVKFDGYSDGVLIDAKGPGYGNFVEHGGFADWFDERKFIDQAKRQLSASEGYSIRWTFADQEAANAVQDLFSRRGISWVDVNYAKPVN